jgi:hypothetical protein
LGSVMKADPDTHKITWPKIRQFARLFRRVIGRVSSLAALAASRGKHWYQGVGANRLVFG